MYDNKQWYESKAVWGGIIAVGAAAAGALGYAVDADTQDQLAEMITPGRQRDRRDHGHCWPCEGR